MGRMGMFQAKLNMGVSKNSGTPKSSILIGFSIINLPFWGTPIFGNPHMKKHAKICALFRFVFGDRMMLRPFRPLFLKV